MKKNEGYLERAIRILSGIVIFSLVFVGPKSNWGLLGLVLVITGVLGWCPLYSLIEKINGKISHQR